jgi:lipoate-protein ligase A
VPTVWWHSTNRPTLILGAGQSLNQVNRAACEAAGVLLVKRQAGGAAVYAGPGVLGLDVALPPDHPLVLPDVVETYRWLGEVWLAALAPLGVRGRLVSVQEARAQVPGPFAQFTRMACFGSLSPYEVTLGGRKLVGLAQVRRRGRALLQAGIHLGFDAHGLSSLLASDDPAGLAGALADAAVGLAEVAPGNLAEADVMSAFAQALEQTLEVELEAGDWTEEERRHAGEVLGVELPEHAASRDR